MHFNLKEILSILNEKNKLIPPDEQKEFYNELANEVELIPKGFERKSVANSFELTEIHVFSKFKREKKEIEKIIADKYDILKKDLPEKIKKQLHEAMHNQKLKVAFIYGGIAAAIVTTLSYLFRPKLNKK